MSCHWQPPGDSDVVVVVAVAVAVAVALAVAVAVVAVVVVVAVGDSGVLLPPTGMVAVHTHRRQRTAGEARSGSETWRG